MIVVTASAWMWRGTLSKRNSAPKEKPLRKGSSRSIRLPMLTDGQYSIAEGSSEGKGRRNEFRLPMHLPQYASRKELEQMVQGEVGGRIEEGPEDGEASTVRKGQGEIEWQRLSEVQTISESLRQNTQDIWLDVDWSEESSDQEKEG